MNPEAKKRLDAYYDQVLGFGKTSPTALPTIKVRPPAMADGGAIRHAPIARYSPASAS